MKNKNRGKYLSSLLHQFQYLSKRNVLSQAKSIIALPPLTDRVVAAFEWHAGGVRSCLVDEQTGDFEEDFVITSNDRSLHLLNYSSPGYTASFAAAHKIAEIVAI